MVEKEIIAKDLKIKQKSVFDMGELYKVMFNWFSQHNYDFQEKQYLEKKSADGSRELEIIWIATRKINDYIKFQIEVKFRPNQLVDVEVEIDGKKRGMNKGNNEIIFNSTLLKDYENKWDNSPVKRFVREIYDTYFIRGKIGDYKAELYAEVYELIDEVKAFLNMYKFQGVAT